MALSHFAYTRRNVISSGVAVAMAATMAFPAVALADATNGPEGDSTASHSAGLEADVSVDEAAASSAGVRVASCEPEQRCNVFRRL